jgi:serine/threonine-protein phosphatase 2A regulatory subunit B''
VELIQNVLALPSYFALPFMRKHCSSQNKVTKKELQDYWTECGHKAIHKKAFLLLTSDPNKKCLSIDDFKELLKAVMEYHPGLEFLKSTPEFQEFYSTCVVSRMFFMANLKGDYRMTYREFKNSNILKSLYDIQADPEINANTDFFCYEDFYVMYIKFWELDTSHKFLLSKDEFAKYCSYTLSRKTVERVFSQVPRKFQNPNGMNFWDFVWFIYCAEDKSTSQSIAYWFKVLDLDSNGIVTGYELEFFFEEQCQRLDYSESGSSDFNFENIICQMYAAHYLGSTS